MSAEHNAPHLLFFSDAYYVKSNKKCEFEIYQLEVNALENKKKLADIGYIDKNFGGSLKWY